MLERATMVARARRGWFVGSVLCFCGFGWVGVSAQESAPNADGRQQEKVRSLLRQRCARCHGPLKPKAQLNLSSLRGAARGGESGAAVHPGNVGQSLLWKRVKADEMPPKSPLSTADKALLRAWIEEGAAGMPRGKLGPRVGADHWAFQALEKTVPPSVRDTRRVRTSVDRYVQARLEARGLSLGPDANRATLIRRVSLDLTGLPPTTTAIDGYLADRAPGAYERMVERYLASPRFGERWGKHWLDAAGYADSNGYFSADTDRPQAYRYRDYVIRSINTGKSFDRFVREQLAGDELSGFRPGKPTTPATIELLVATHFLRNGQDGTDIGVKEPEAFEIDRRAALEAVVHVTASSLLGLTVQCARCHDHKFEPITQKEYYQFQAIMFPAFNPQDWVNPKDRIVRAYLPGEKEAWREKEKRLTAALAKLRADYVSWVAAHREPSEVLFRESFSSDAWTRRWSNTAPGDEQTGGKVAIGKGASNIARVEKGQLQIVAGPREAWLSTVKAFDWTPDSKGSWVQATFDLVDNKVGGKPAQRIGYTIAAYDFDDSSPGQGGNILIDGNPSIATTVYRDYPGGDQKVVGRIGKQGYVPARNYGVRITRLDNDEFELEHLVDGVRDGNSLRLNAADLPDGGFAFFYCLGRSYIVDNLLIERSLPSSDSRPGLAKRRKELEARRERYQRNRRELETQRAPEPGRPIAWVTDKSPHPVDAPFLTRGLYHLRGPKVGPGVLSMLSDSADEYRPVATENTTGRRLALANWLTRPEGRPAALMARVHVNRIWQQYFGRGIVDTTDNLGVGGAAPTHPDLLNHLAAGFIAGGWKQKELHRRLVRSTVYRQSSAPRAAGLAADPANRFLWRRPIRRLRAEVIRDSLLAVAGQLDSTPFGPYVSTRQTPVGEVVVDESRRGARRRSVYLQQRRSQTLSLLKLFDAPSVATICTARPASTVPLQSLTLLNSEFAVKRSESFADRLLRETDGRPSSLVRRAWRLATGRQPTVAERALARRFLDTQQRHYGGPNRRRLALADFCQMLLASNAFLYLE